MCVSPDVNDEVETTHELRFASLFQEGRGLSFPCDAHGLVDIDGLSERARNNYLLARAAVGRDYAKPRVERVFAPPAWRHCLEANAQANWLASGPRGSLNGSELAPPLHA